MIYIISQLSTDLRSVIELYEQYSNEESIIILTYRKENYQFLISCELKKAEIRYIELETKINKSTNKYTTWLTARLNERNILDQIIDEVRSSNDNQVIFHALNSDPLTAYLIYQIVETNPVIYIDVLMLNNQPIKIINLISLMGLKNYLYFSLIKRIFGPIFFLSGNVKHQYITFDLARIKSKYLFEKKNDFDQDILEKYKYKINQQKIILLLYSNSFGVPEDQHNKCFQSLIEILIENKFLFYIKCHPQSTIPVMFSEFPQVPKHIPFEFLDSRNIVLIIGCFSAAMANAKICDVISIAKLIYSERSPYYIEGVRQLSQNPKIQYVYNIDQVAKLLKKYTSKTSHTR